MTKFTVLTSIVLFATACSSPSTDQTTDVATKEIFFFDLESYFTTEIARLKAQKSGAEKILEINGETETLKVDSLNLEKELAIFKQSDINKTSWADKYNGDTTIVGGKIQQITYTALEEDLKTKKIIIEFANDKVEDISIENEVDSPVLKSKQQLHYQPNQGYSIAQTQKIRLMKENDLKVKVVFRN
ncbi:MAG: hypothetical protein AAF242_09995 [Bacteroidota bacterium]